MFRRVCFCLPAIIALVGSSSPVRADLTQITIGGPGGTGSATINPSNPTEAGGEMNFTSVDTINIVIQVNSPGGYYFIDFGNGVPGAMGITNNTGESWTTFLLQGNGL